MADTNIDNLKIEVKASSDAAEASLRALLQTMQDLKKACQGGCGLKGFVNPLKDVADAAKGMDNSAAAKLSSMATALSKLSGLGKFNIPASLGDRIRDLGSAVTSLQSGLEGPTQDRLASLSQALGALRDVSDIRISANVGNQIKEIGAAASLLPADIAAKLQGFGDAMRGLQGLGEIRISSTVANNLLDLGIAAEQLSGIDFSGMEHLAQAAQALNGLTIPPNLNTQLTRLAETAEKIKDVDFSGFTNLSAALGPLIAQIQTLNGSVPNLAQYINQLNQATSNMARSSRNASASTVNLAAGLMVAYRSVERVSRTIAGWIDKSNQYIENVNLFNASMGEYAEQAANYAYQVGELMGIDPGTWMRNQGVFQTLATGFGVAADRAYIMSKNLTQLGYDLSSFFNISVDDAMLKLQSGLSGELEPLRRLGYDLSQARLKAVALQLGIRETFNEMSQAEKAQLRYYAILTQVTTAQGDMARTLDTPANQLRVLKAQAEQAARALGNTFIPVLNAILPYAIAAANAIRTLANALASLFGFAMPEVDYSGISGATSAAEGLDSALTGAGGSAKKLNELLADWDELNIIQSESGGGGGGGGAASGADNWDWALPEYDFLGGLIQTRADAILAEWQPVITWIKDNLESILALGEGIGSAILGWSLAKRFIPSIKNTNGLLNNLLKGVAAIGIEAATIALNIHFTADYLQTGKWGSLAGGIITDIAGSSLVGRIVQTMFTDEKLGKTVGTITTGISFVINGLISMNMGIDDVTAQGITQENLITLVKSGLETALGISIAANSYIEHTLGGKTKMTDKLLIGAAALALTANVMANVTLTKDALNNDNVLEVFASMGTDIGTALGAGVAVERLLGDKAGWAVTGLTLTADAVTDLTLAIGDKNANGWTAANITEMATSAIEAAAGVAFLAKMKLGDKIHVVPFAAAGLGAFANVALNLELSEGGLTEGDPLKILASLGTNALTAAEIGTSVYFAFDSKKKAFVATGIVFAADALMDLYMGVGDIAENGITVENVMETAKGALEAAVSGGLIASYGLKGTFDAKTAVRGGATMLLAAVGVGASVWLMKDAANQEDANKAAWEVGGSMLMDVLTAGFVGLEVKRMTGNKKYGWLVSGVTMGITAGITAVEVHNSVEENGLEESSILTGLKGALEFAAAGVGIGMTVGHPVAGGLIGAAIGLAVEAFAIISALNMSAAEDFVVIWGDTELSEDDIQKKVNSFFDFDVSAHVNSISLQIDETTTISNAVNGDLANLEKSLTGLRIGLDKQQSYTDIHDILVGKDGEMGKGTLIGDVKELISQNAINVSDFIKAGTDSTGQGASLVSLMNLTSQDITRELNEAGKLWGEYFSNGFEAVASEAANNLLTYIYEITSAAAKGRRKAEFQIAFGNLGLQDMTSATAGKVVDEYIKTENELLQRYIEAEQEEFASITSQRDAYQAMVDNWSLAHPEEAIPDEYLTRLQQLKDQWELLNQEIENGEYSQAHADWLADVAEARALMKAELKDAYSYQKEISEMDLGFNTGDNLDYQKDVFQSRLGLEGAIGDYYYGYGSYDAVVSSFDKYLQDILQQNMREADFAPLKAALDQGILSVFDVFTPAEMNAILERFSSQARGTYTDDFTSVLVDALFGTGDSSGQFSLQGVQRQIIESAANSAGVDMLDVLSYWKQNSGDITNYDQMTEMYLRVLHAISEAGTEWKTLLDNTADVPDLSIPEPDYSGPVGAVTNLGTTVTETASTIHTGVQAIVKDLALLGSISFGSSPGLGGRGSLSSFRGFIPSISFAPAAAGGLFDEGEFFMARERGPELVGQIGHKTAVANNKQIEGGISLGVKEANEGVERGLDRLHDDMRVLITKSGRMRLEPSTALARTVKRSEEMRLQSEGV